MRSPFTILAVAALAWLSLPLAADSGATGLAWALMLATAGLGIAGGLKLVLAIDRRGASHTANHVERESE